MWFSLIPEHISFNPFIYFAVWYLQIAPLGTILLKVKLLDFGDPRTVLSKALSPPNLGDLVNTMLQLKGVNNCSCVFSCWMFDLSHLIHLAYYKYNKTKVSKACFAFRWEQSLQQLTAVAKMKTAS